MALKIEANRLLIFSKFIFDGKEIEKFSPGAVFEDEIEFFLILEAPMEFDEEGMIDFGEDGLFGHDVFFLIFFDDVSFLEHFEGV